MPSEQKVGKILVNNSICGNNVVDAQYVKVFLHSNDKHVFGLVGTGAGTSVGNPQLLAKLPSDVMGVVNIICTISGQQVTLPVQIINDSLYELVLGRGFLQQQGAVIDFKDGTFMLQPQGPVDIKATCTFEIPPKSETIVSGKN